MSKGRIAVLMSLLVAMMLAITAPAFAVTFPTYHQGPIHTYHTGDLGIYTYENYNSVIVRDYAWMHKEQKSALLGLGHLHNDFVMCKNNVGVVVTDATTYNQAKANGYSYSGSMKQCKENYAGYHLGRSSQSDPGSEQGVTTPDSDGLIPVNYQDVKPDDSYTGLTTYGDTNSAYVPFDTYVEYPAGQMFYNSYTGEYYSEEEPITIYQPAGYQNNIIYYIEPLYTLTPGQDQLIFDHEEAHAVYGFSHGQGSPDYNDAYYADPYDDPNFVNA